MRLLVLLAPLALAGCVTVAPQEASYVRRASPRQAANAFYYRQTTVETCDGRTLSGQIFTSRGDSLDLRPTARVAWTNIRSMTATQGRSPIRAAAVLGGGAGLTGLAALVASATGERCGVGCDRDTRAETVAATLALGGVMTLFATTVTFGSTPRRTLRYGFDCPALPPE